MCKTARILVLVTTFLTLLAFVVLIPSRIAYAYAKYFLDGSKLYFVEETPTESSKDANVLGEFSGGGGGGSGNDSGKSDGDGNDSDNDDGSADQSNDAKSTPSVPSIKVRPPASKPASIKVIKKSKEDQLSKGDRTSVEFSIERSVGTTNKTKIEKALESELDRDEFEKITEKIRIKKDLGTATSGTSGKILLKIKERTETGRVELKIREDGRVEFKVKAKASKSSPNAASAGGQADKEATSVQDLVNEIIETDKSEEILSIIPDNSNGNKVKINREEGKLEIEVNASSAVTSFPISINPETNAIEVRVGAEDKKLQILPDKAVAAVINSRVAGTVTNSTLDENTDSATSSADKLVYNIKGLKTLKFLGTVPISTQINAVVGAQSGQVLKEEKSTFLNLFGFLFTE